MIILSYLIGILVLIVSVVAVLLSIRSKLIGTLAMTLLLSLSTFALSGQTAPIAHSLGYQQVVYEEANGNIKPEQQASLEMHSDKLKPKLRRINAAQIGISLVQFLMIRRSIR